MPAKAPFSLPEVFMNIHIIHTLSLTMDQKKQIDELVLACCRNDGIRLSYPLDLSEKDGEHFLLKGPDQKLLGILGIVFTILILPNALPLCILTIGVRDIFPGFLTGR